MCHQRSDADTLTSDDGVRNGMRLVQQVSARVSDLGYTCHYTDSMRYPERESGRPPSLTEMEFAICRSQIQERCSTLALDQVEVTSSKEVERDAKESEGLAAALERLKEELRSLPGAEPPRH